MSSFLVAELTHIVYSAPEQTFWGFRGHTCPDCLRFVWVLVLFAFFFDRPFSTCPSSRALRSPSLRFNGLKGEGNGWAYLLLLLHQRHRSISFAVSAVPRWGTLHPLKSSSLMQSFTKFFYYYSTQISRLRVEVKVCAQAVNNFITCENEKKLQLPSSTIFACAASWYCSSSAFSLRIISSAAEIPSGRSARAEESSACFNRTAML